MLMLELFKEKIKLFVKNIVETLGFKDDQTFWRIYIIEDDKKAKSVKFGMCCDSFLYPVNEFSLTYEMASNILKTFTSFDKEELVINRNGELLIKIPPVLAPDFVSLLKTLTLGKDVGSIPKMKKSLLDDVAKKIDQQGRIQSTDKKPVGKLVKKIKKTDKKPVTKTTNTTKKVKTVTKFDTKSVKPVKRSAKTVVKSNKVKTTKGK